MPPTETQSLKDVLKRRFRRPDAEDGRDLAGQHDGRSAEDMSLTELIAEDFETYEREAFSPGFWAVAVHRVGERTAGGTSIRDRSLSAASRVAAKAVDLVWGIHLPPTTRVGRRVHIWHFGSLLLNARSIGNDVHIRHDTTLGPVRNRDRDRPEALPVIEDGVDIGSGACVVGGVTVGRGAMVGANTVVMEAVPPGTTAFGVPARIMPK